MLWVMFGEERLHPGTEMPPFAGFSLQRKRRQPALIRVPRSAPCPQAPRKAPSWGTAAWCC